MLIFILTCLVGWLINEKNSIKCTPKSAEKREQHSKPAQAKANKKPKEEKKKSDWKIGSFFNRKDSPIREIEVAPTKGSSESSMSEEKPKKEQKKNKKKPKNQKHNVFSSTSQEEQSERELKYKKHDQFTDLPRYNQDLSPGNIYFGHGEHKNCICTNCHCSGFYLKNRPCRHGMCY